MRLRPTLAGVDIDADALLVQYRNGVSAEKTVDHAGRSTHTGPAGTRHGISEKDDQPCQNPERQRRDQRNSILLAFGVRRSDLGTREICTSH